MNVLIKPHQYSKWMRPELADPEQVLNLIAHPLISPDKDRAPLAIWGDMVSDPELDPESGKPRCTGANVDSILCLQLDYDSGVTIEQFCEQYKEYRWTLYTSYSYGYKPGDRFRVILPLSTRWPCYLLENRRVRNNLCFHFTGVDPCCFDRGHWQILPCIRSPQAPYVHIRSNGTELWGADFRLWTYDQWYREDLEAARERRKLAQEAAKEVDQFQLLADLENELQALPVGCGSRYAGAKSLLAKYAGRGLGTTVLMCACPWPGDKKWERRWDSLINWASTLD